MLRAVFGGIIISLASLMLALAATPALASNCSAYPYTLTNGTTADANQVMANFNAALNCMNNNLPGLANSNTYTSGGQDFAASTTSLASINIAPGVAPTSPNNGDFWITSSGAFVRVNGATIQLGGAAPCTAFGTTAGTCAQGNDSRITGAAQLASTNSFSGGTQTFTASSSAGASINLPPGIAPTSSNNGDIWETSAAVFAQVNGVTEQLLSSSQNLADLASASTARTNLGVTATGSDTTYAYRSNNLSDLSSATSALVNLGLNVNGAVKVTTGGVVSQASCADLAGGCAGTAGPPQGRLTLTSGTPVTQSDVATATSVYYDPYYGGQAVPIYNGAAFVMTSTGGELTDALDSTNIVSGNVYDEFVINSSGVHVCTGPAWSSTTSRGTGAGTTQLTSLNGVYVNAVSITCRWGSSSTASVSANQATYVGSFLATANGQASDTARQRILWNQYNRVQRYMTFSESTASWTYSTATFRQANGDSSAQLEVLAGQAEGGIVVTNSAQMTNGTSGGGGTAGIGVDSTTMNSGSTDQQYPGGSSHYLTSNVFYSGALQLGWNYFAKLEAGNGTATNTWYGPGSPIIAQVNN